MFQAINILLTYWEVGVYLKYCTPQSLSKLLKIRKNVDAFKKLCVTEHELL